MWFVFGYEDYYPAGADNDWLAAYKTFDECKLHVMSRRLAGAYHHDNYVALDGATGDWWNFCEGAWTLGRKGVCGSIEPVTSAQTDLQVLEKHGGRDRD